MSSVKAQRQVVRSQSPTFEKKILKIFKKDSFFCVLTECVLFQCMDHLETWGVTLFSS